MLKWWRFVYAVNTFRAFFFTLRFPILSDSCVLLRLGLVFVKLFLDAFLDINTVFKIEKLAQNELNSLYLGS